MRLLTLVVVLASAAVADARPRRVVYVQPAPVVVRPQTVVVQTCPGGVCPVRPVYVAPVRRSFFWGW